MPSGVSPVHRNVSGCCCSEAPLPHYSSVRMEAAVEKWTRRCGGGEVGWRRDGAALSTQGWRVNTNRWRRRASADALSKQYQIPFQRAEVTLTSHLSPVATVSSPSLTLPSTWKHSGLVWPAPTGQINARHYRAKSVVCLQISPMKRYNFFPPARSLRSALRCKSFWWLFV